MPDPDKGAPDQTFLKLQEAGVPYLLHLADAQQAALSALMPPPHVLDVGCSSIQLWVPLHPLPCDVPPASAKLCRVGVQSHLGNDCLRCKAAPPVLCSGTGQTSSSQVR